MAPNKNTVTQKTDQYGFIPVAGSKNGSDPDTKTNGELKSTNHSEEYGARNRIREMKWIDMFNRWDIYIEKNQRKLRDRCRKGIPQSCRGKAWSKLSSAFKMQNNRKHIYPMLLSQTLDPKLADEIKRDLHRTLPQHTMFNKSSGIGQTKLFEVLKCYAVYNPKVGYCQSLSPITAMLLLYLDCEEAFWVLVRIVDVYLVDYFDETMRGIQIDALIFREMCKKFLPKFFAVISKCQIDFVVLVQKWFFCVFSRTLPWNITLRVWDTFFFEGKWSLFRIGLTVLKYALIDIVKHPSSVDEFTVLNTINRFNGERLDEEKFLTKSLEYKVTSEAKKKLNELCARRYEKKKRMEASAASRSQDDDIRSTITRVISNIFNISNNKPSEEQEHVGKRQKQQREHVESVLHDQDALADVLKSEEIVDIEDNADCETTLGNLTAGTIEGVTTKGTESAVNNWLSEKTVVGNGHDADGKHERLKTQTALINNVIITPSESSTSVVIEYKIPLSPKQRQNTNVSNLPQIEN